jgi:hypothetical protein
MLPKSAIGKVLKKDLRAQLMVGRSSDPGGEGRTGSSDSPRA